MRWMALALVLGGCTTEIGDDVKNLVDLHLAPAPYATRLTLVPSGGAVWGVGIAPSQNSSQVEPVVWSGNVATGTSTVAWTTNSSIGVSVTPYRLQLAPHPRLPLAYVAGGLVTMSGSAMWAPGVQVLTPTLTGPLAAPDATLSYIHPMFGSSSFGLSEYPFDPVGYQTSSNNSQDYTAFQAPLTMTAYTDPVGGGERLVALLPLGLEGGTAPADSRINGGMGSATSHYHRRALAFFDLDANGLLVDACPGSSELALNGSSVATTEPSWIIDLPSTVFAEKAVLPARMLSSSNGYSFGGADLRLYPLTTMGPSIYGQQSGDAALDRYFQQQLMPAAPELVVDPAHGRGFLFVNRWVGDDLQTADGMGSVLGGDSPPGHAVLIGFSLASPGRTGCTRTGSGGDAFAGLEDATAVLDIAAGLSPTEGIEPVVLMENLQNMSGGSDLSNIFNDGQGCSLFSNNLSNGSLPCFTDAVPYAPIALDHGTNRLVVTQSRADSVLVYDAAQLSATPVTVPVGTTPVSVGVDDAGHAYVVNRGSDSLTIVDLASGTRTADVTVGKRPVSLYVDTGRAAGTLVYVLDLFGDNIAIVDPSTRSVRFAPTCARPAELFVDPSTRTAIVQCKGSVEYQRDCNGGNCAPGVIAATAMSFRLL